MTDANGERESVFDHRLFKIIAIVADVSAFVAVVAGLTGALIVFGLVTVLLGMIQLWGRRGKPLDRWATFAIASIVAGAMAFTVVVDRALIGATSPSLSTSASQITTGSSSPISTSTTATNTPAPAGSSASLVDMKAVGDGDLRSGPLKVNGTNYDRVKSGRPYYCEKASSPVNDTYQIDRKYRTFEAQVGLGDESPSSYVVKFSVIVDGDTKRVERVGVGQVRPVKVDVTGALRVELKAELDDNCGKSAVAAWIDPVVM